ncbi:MAG: hypothetical protein WBD73_10405 [Candidatus Acidiferrales bacterium]
MAAEPTELQHGALITREAHVALRDLKALVDLATKEIHTAEIETIGWAIGRAPGDDPRQTLLAAAETLRSPKFESALREARAKMEIAVAWHLPKGKAANSQ